MPSISPDMMVMICRCEYAATASSGAGADCGDGVSMVVAVKEC